VIALREIAVSLFRVAAAKRGVSVPAKPLAKAKTFVQCVAIGSAFIPEIGNHHPGIVQVHAVGQLHEQRPYYVMELIEGTTLHQEIERAGRMAMRDALRVGYITRERVPLATRLRYLGSGCLGRRAVDIQHPHSGPVTS